MGRPRPEAAGGVKASQNEIGDAVRRARVARNWTQKDLAREARVATSYISMIEVGERENVSTRMLDRILSKLELRIAIVSRSDEIVHHAIAPATLRHVDELVKTGVHGVGRTGVVESCFLRGLREALK